MALAFGLGLGLSQVRRAGGAFAPASLFQGGEWGVLIDPTVGPVFTDAAGTTAAVANDPVGRIDDNSGNGVHATQATAAARPEWTDGDSLTFDGVDDALEVTVPTGVVGTLYYAGDKGTAAFGVDLPAGTYIFGYYKPSFWSRNFSDRARAFLLIDRTLTDDEVSDLDSHFAGGDFEALTDGNNMFAGSSITSLPSAMTLGSLTKGAWMFRNNSLTSLPSAMTLGSLINGNNMFAKNALTSLPSGMTLGSLEDGFNMFAGNSITSLPSAMTLGSLTNASRMFRDNPLADVPADFASESDCTNWDDAFTDTNLTQTSIDTILTNLDARGTSNGVFDQSGGSAPSATGETAIDNMRARGWAITVTGGY